MGKFVQSFIVSLIKVLNSLIKTQETAIIGLITTGVIIINHWHREDMGFLILTSFFWD